jgi:hypothetical protein
MKACTCSVACQRQQLRPVGVLVQRLLAAAAHTP